MRRILGKLWSFAVCAVLLAPGTARALAPAPPAAGVFGAGPTTLALSERVGWAPPARPAPRLLTPRARLYLAPIGRPAPPFSTRRPTDGEGEFTAGLLLFLGGGAPLFAGTLFYAIGGGKWDKFGRDGGRMALVGLPFAVIGAVLLANGTKKMEASGSLADSAPRPEVPPTGQDGQGPTCARVAEQVVHLLAALGDQAALKPGDIPRLVEGCERTGNLASQPQTVDCLMSATSFQQARASCDLDGLVKPWLEASHP